MGVGSPRYVLGPLGAPAIGKQRLVVSVCLSCLLLGGSKLSAHSCWFGLYVMDSGAYITGSHSLSLSLSVSLSLSLCRSLCICVYIYIYIYALVYI